MPGPGSGTQPSAVRVGRARAVSLGLEALLAVEEADLNQPLPCETSSFDAVVSLDVVLHLRDRLSLFHEVARLLRPGGRFLFTDAGVLTGSISNEDVRKRSAHGYTQFVAAEWNEALLECAGLRLIETGNRTMNFSRTPAAD
jgi:SAM-dependent methyltransferase